MIIVKSSKPKQMASTGKWSPTSFFSKLFCKRTDKRAAYKGKPMSIIRTHAPWCMIVKTLHKEKLYYVSPKEREREREREMPPENIILAKVNLQSAQSKLFFYLRFISPSNCCSLPVIACFLKKMYISVFSFFLFFEKDIFRICISCSLWSQSFNTIWVLWEWTDGAGKTWWGSPLKASRNHHGTSLENPSSSFHG